MIEYGKEKNRSPTGEKIRSIDAFLAALSFLTIFPVTKSRDMEVEVFAKSLLFFPLIGLITGCFVSLIIWLFHYFLPSGLLCFFAVLFLGMVSGFFHYDGLADTADGFFSARKKEEILQIMRDSRIGTMGVIGLIFIIAGKYICLYELDREFFYPALICTPFAGRCSIAVQMKFLDYARKKDGGLGTLFYSKYVNRSFGYVAVFSFLVLVVFFHLKSFYVLSLLTVVLFLYVQVCRKIIGGATGDTLGAGCEIVEFAFLFSMVLV